MREPIDDLDALEQGVLRSLLALCRIAKRAGLRVPNLERRIRELQR